MPDFLSITDANADLQDSQAVDAWRSNPESRVFAAGGSGAGNAEFLVVAPPPASALWHSTIVAVVGPIHPDPGYNGGILPLACGHVDWAP
jgi:hypothetical protein